MSDSEYFSGSSSSSYNGSSGNEADSEGEYYGRGVREVTDMLKNFNPYMFEPEKNVSSTSSSSTSKSEETETENEVEGRVTNLDWCTCGCCKKEKREIDCLCCQEVSALNCVFDNENVNCVVSCNEFKTLCLNELVLRNVLTGLHETRGDPIEHNISNRSLRYAAYKQFIWWIFKNLGKGNRRVIPSCALWKIRELFPEADGNYVLYSEGKKD